MKKSTYSSKNDAKREAKKQEMEARRREAKANAAKIKERIEAGEIIPEFVALINRFEPNRYSPANFRLLFAQCPEATQLQAFMGWKKLGYAPVKGCHAIYLRAPKDKVDADGDLVMNEEGEEEKNFYWTCLFDISQVEPIKEKKEEEVLQLA